MSRDFGRNHARARIAHLAARLMAEDGIEDYALAKRKAARQAGMSDLRQLPDNDEIDTALKSYRALYRQEHVHELRTLRELALGIMDEFTQFKPHLVGSVLNGNAGKFASIQLQLFVENSKDVELYVINRGIEYKSSPHRFYAGKLLLEVPTLTLARDGIDIHLTILSLRDLRHTLKTSVEGKPIERADRIAVMALLATR
jgi:hypothetical protein